MIGLVITAGILLAIHILLEALPATRLTNVLRNVWAAFWGLIFLSTIAGVLLLITGLAMLTIGLFTANLWLMLIGFIIAEIIAIGFAAGLSVVGLGAQAHRGLQYGLVILLTATVIRFAILLAGGLITGPRVAALLVTSILIWIIAAVILRGDPRKYVRACAWVAVYWWILFLGLSIYHSDDFLQSLYDARVGAKKEVATVENQLSAAIERQKAALTGQKLNRAKNLGDQYQFKYIDLLNFGKDSLYGFDDGGYLLPDSVAHREKIMWYPSRPTPPAVSVVLEATGAVYIRKADANGMYTPAGAGIWIPLLKGENGASFLSEIEPQPLPAPTDPGGGGLGGQPGARPAGQEFVLRNGGQTWTVPADGQVHELAGVPTPDPGQFKRFDTPSSLWGYQVSWAHQRSDGSWTTGQRPFSVDHGSTYIQVNGDSQWPGQPLGIKIWPK